MEDQGAVTPKHFLRLSKEQRDTPDEDGDVPLLQRERLMETDIFSFLFFWGGKGWIQFRVDFFFLLYWRIVPLDVVSDPGPFGLDEWFFMQIP